MDDRYTFRGRNANGTYDEVESTPARPMTWSTGAASWIPSETSASWRTRAARSLSAAPSPANGRVL